ncbi:MAG: histidine phosphatase family protein [Acutalibacteraceae bacterium]|nr:histidine phosphatase family protein [Acutalibacteraceae bacterium]
MLLFYVRHGHPTYNPDCLTEAGFKEAEALVCRMKRIKPDKIFASTSTRAIQTAEPTAKFFNKEITKLDWCNENHAWRELTVETEDKRRTWLFSHAPSLKLMSSGEMRNMGENWYSHPNFEKYHFEYGINRIKKETYAFLESLGYRYTENGYEAVNPNDDRIAIFAHQGFGIAFLSAVLDIPYPQIATRFDMTYTGISVIEFNSDGPMYPKLLQLSNDSHLFAADMETVYNNTHNF